MALPPMDAQAELVSMLQVPDDPPGAGPLEEIQAAPGEVPALHSDRGLYLMWISLALCVFATMGFFAWAVFMRKPY